ncbi:hypothetical protein S40288_00505 [Stachybotrys chartarum IBT 40288]|nr:hypothetical protein S40288_00505 [Stachybotrys chartarum IBT 40288]
MPPLPPPANPLPRLVMYYQTHHDAAGNSISILPLLTQPGIAVTHVILAAIHINGEPDELTLNDHRPDHARFQTLWAELRVLQASGIRVMGMLGGAARGSYERLDASDEQFERFYLPLRDLVRDRGLDGLDLDVEEEMSLLGIIRLIDRLRADFGKDFIITMAPVAMALLDFTRNLSGFDYEALEVMRGREIAWYNTQFYCGWGDLNTSMMYDAMIQRGWSPEKIVIGLVTNPDNGSGFVPFDLLKVVMAVVRGRHPQLGGIMGWEYFNGLPGGTQRPWEWARQMTVILHGLPKFGVPQVQEDEEEADGAIVPEPFDYYSDGLDD